MKYYTNHLVVYKRSASPCGHLRLFTQTEKSSGNTVHYRSFAYKVLVALWLKAGDMLGAYIVHQRPTNILVGVMIDEAALFLRAF